MKKQKAILSFLVIVIVIVAIVFIAIINESASIAAINSLKYIGLGSCIFLAANKKKQILKKFKQLLK